MLQIVLILTLAGFIFYHLKIKPLPPAARKKMMVRGGITLGVVALFLGAVTGHVHWLGALVAAAVAMARSGLVTGVHLGRFWFAKTGGVAQFSTEYLAVTFNAGSLLLQGKIKKGLYASLELHQLDDAQLQELMDYYQTRDRKSYYLIHALRQRRGFSGAGEAIENIGTPAIDEALSILGLEGRPTREEVILAHRRLINKLHPDRGGSDYLASQVNLARDQLLKHFELKS